MFKEEEPSKFIDVTNVLPAPGLTGKDQLSPYNQLVLTRYQSARERQFKTLLKPRFISYSDDELRWMNSDAQDMIDFLLDPKKFEPTNETINIAYYELVKQRFYNSNPVNGHIKLVNYNWSQPVYDLDWNLIRNIRSEMRLSPGFFSSELQLYHTIVAEVREKPMHTNTPWIEKGISLNTNQGALTHGLHRFVNRTPETQE